MSNIPSLTRAQRVALIGLTVLAVLFGFVVRIHGLGTWPLSVDEYYLTKSVLSILENGLPGYECGGFYLRGVLQQYVSAVAVATVGNTELAMRLYPLAASLILLWFVFLLGRRAGGVIAGSLVLILLSLSLWEIEYSRFARMYMPFQALTVVQVYLFMRLVIDGNTDSFKWMLLVFLIALFSYEGAIFIAALPVIAVIRERALKKLHYILAATGMMLITVIYREAPLATIGLVRMPLPDEVVAVLAARRGEEGSMFPDLGHLGMLVDQPTWLIALVVIVSISCLYSLKSIRSLTPIGKLAWVLALASFSVSLVGLGMAIFICMILIMLDREGRIKACRFLYRVVIPVAIIMSVFWASFLALQLDVGPRSIAAALVKYPNVSAPLFYELMEVIPVLMTVLILPVIIYALVLIISKKYHDDMFVLLGGLTIMFFIAVSLVTSGFFETRYAFFIFPLLVTLFAVSVVRLSTMVFNPGRVAIVLPLLVIAIYAVTEDFDINHYININTAEVNYRIGYSAELREHFKSRNDGRTPSQFINSRARDIDTIIIAESAPDYYLDRVDYRFKNMEFRNFPNHILCGLEHDKWSNAPVLYKEEQIDELINTSVGDVWLIETIRYYGEWQKKMDRYEVYRAPDTRTRVLQMPARGDS